MRRLTRLVLGLAFLGGSGIAVALSVVGFDTEFAKTTLSCGAPVAEAMPEDRPSGPTAAEREYIERTHDETATRAYEADVVDYLEAKACTAEARDRLTWYLPAAVVAWTAGGFSLRSAVRRKPKPPAMPGAAGRRELRAEARDVSDALGRVSASDSANTESAKTEG